MASSTWRPHRLHKPDRTWAETNCYVDLWIGLLHSRGLTVEAMLGFTVAVDFEFDQWTFFKPRVGDLDALYGIGVEELTTWRALAEHAVVHTRPDRAPLIEVDSFYLPDTQGRDYRESHTKTTIAIVGIDPQRRRAHVLPQPGALFPELGKTTAASSRSIPVRGRIRCPPYCEIARFDRSMVLPESELRARAMTITRGHFDRRPSSNPFERAADQIEADLEAVAEGGESYFDRYAFATLRQCGAAFASWRAAHVEWLAAGRPSATKAGAAFTSIGDSASRLVLKMARVAHGGRNSVASMRRSRRWPERGIADRPRWRRSCAYDPSPPAGLARSARHRHGLAGHPDRGGCLRDRAGCGGASRTRAGPGTMFRFLRRSWNAAASSASWISTTRRRSRWGGGSRRSTTGT